MSNLRQAIDKLMSSPHYKELADYEPPFNSFEIAGVTHRELTHSSVLAWLLRDGANKEFRQRFVAWIKNNILIKLQGKLDSLVPETSEKTKEDLIKLQEVWKGLDVPKKPEASSLKPKIVKTEKGDKTSRIDVFAHFESLDLVIGIEVKVNADEQPDQVERYQKFLCQKYSGYKKAVVFLTPTGWKPETADENNVYVPVLAMSWGCVSEIIREMRSTLGDKKLGDKNRFRMQFLQHLERNIVMNEIEEQRIVRELLSEDDDNLETIGKIIKNMSSLQTSLEYKFWTELRKKLQEQDQLRDEDSEFQLYKSGVLEVEVIEDDRLEECIRRKNGGLGLTFRIPGSSLDHVHEVVCRITHDPGYVYYGFVLCLCDKDNIRKRVAINDEKHEEYLCLYRKIGLTHGPDKVGKDDRELGWLGWNERAEVNLNFANKPHFDTLVKIKKDKRKCDVVEDLIREIFGVIKTIYPEQEKGE